MITPCSTAACARLPNSARRSWRGLHNGPEARPERRRAATLPLPSQRREADRPLGPVCPTTDEPFVVATPACPPLLAHSYGRPWWSPPVALAVAADLCVRLLSGTPAAATPACPPTPQGDMAWSRRIYPTPGVTAPALRARIESRRSASPAPTYPSRRWRFVR